MRQPHTGVGMPSLACFPTPLPVHPLAGVEPATEPVRSSPSMPHYSLPRRLSAGPSAFRPTAAASALPAATSPSTRLPTAPAAKAAAHAQLPSTAQPAPAAASSQHGGSRVGAKRSAQAGDAPAASMSGQALPAPERRWPGVSVSHKRNWLTRKTTWRAVVLLDRKNHQVRSLGSHVGFFWP